MWQKRGLEECHSPELPGGGAGHRVLIDQCGRDRGNARFNTGGFVQERTHNLAAKLNINDYTKLSIPYEC